MALRKGKPEDLITIGRGILNGSRKVKDGAVRRGKTFFRVIDQAGIALERYGKNIRNDGNGGVFAKSVTVVAHTAIEAVRAPVEIGAVAINGVLRGESVADSVAKDKARAKENWSKSRVVRPAYEKTVGRLKSK